MLNPSPLDFETLLNAEVSTDFPFLTSVVAPLRQSW